MYLKKLLEIIKTESNLNPLSIAYKTRHRYYEDFMEMLKCFRERLTKSAYNDVLKKLINACTNDNQTYLQTVCELNVLYYFVRNYDDFEYEPKYNGKNNPECSFVFQGKKVNIEVKCPNMEKRISEETSKSLKIFPAERIPNYKNVINEIKSILSVNTNKTEYLNIEEIYRMDNKIKDFLISSQKKFPSGNGYFNILVIALEIISDMDEWYNYIFGEQGVFTQNSFVNEDYRNVDAILLSTPVCGHKSWIKYTECNVWKLEETVNLIFLDPRKETSSKGEFYFNNIIDMFGDLTRNFMMFLQSLDENNNEKDQNSVHWQYVIYKMREMNIISMFIDSIS